MSKGTLYRNYLEIILQRHDIIYTRRGCFLQDELYLNNELWYSMHPTNLSDTIFLWYM